VLDYIEHSDVIELRLNRPPVNALSPLLIEAITQKHATAVQSGAGAVVLSGLPGVFSAGLDVVELLSLDRPAIRDFWRAFFGLLRQLGTSPVPVAAALTGHSPAGGAVMALFCDYRVAASGAFKIGFNEVQVGLPLPPLLYSALGRVVGLRQAERLQVSAQLFDPGEAYRLGFVDAVCGLERVVPLALEWCRRLLELPHHAMTQTRGLARHDLAALFDEVDEVTYQEMTGIWFSDETQAAVRQLVERLTKKQHS
jgi:3,2-trans-enoyl-CoA isomerase